MSAFVAMVALVVAGCGSAPTAQVSSSPPSRPSTAVAPSAEGGPATRPTSAPAASGEAASSSACPAWLAAQQRAEGRLYAIDPVASQVRIHVFRAGRLARLGHNHVMGPERMRGQVFVPSEGLAGAGVELDFRIADLVIDKPEWRTALGPEFASQPSAADIDGTRTNLMRAVDGERFPVIAIRSRAVAGAFPSLALRVAVSWHGQVREMDVPVRMERPLGDQPLRAQGALVLRQSDFGIAPFSVLGGLLAIQDELTVDIDVAGRPAVACD
ncbi:YceI family protein [Roseateles aquatilis]|uniref:YceI family protein n=1 Tax=Roseateles aquatilis TaxID=431061 RepID=UPI001130FA72|nr:YceI family protein [Roseateles aquatilis]